jgi:hypothetical protein
VIHLSHAHRHRHCDSFAQYRPHQVRAIDTRYSSLQPGWRWEDMRGLRQPLLHAQHPQRDHLLTREKSVDCFIDQSGGFRGWKSMKLSLSIPINLFITTSPYSRIKSSRSIESTTIHLAYGGLCSCHRIIREVGLQGHKSTPLLRPIAARARKETLQIPWNSSRRL